MRIIKRGYVKKYPRVFECDECGSIFQADKSEYTEVTPTSGTATGEAQYTCNCPVCGVVCSKSVEVQEDFFPQTASTEPEPSAEETEGAE